MGEKGRQDLRKVDTPSNASTCGEPVEKGVVRPPEGRHTIQMQRRHTCGETVDDKERQRKTKEDKGRQGAERQTPGKKAHTWGDNGGQGKARPLETEHTI